MGERRRRTSKTSSRRSPSAGVAFEPRQSPVVSYANVHSTSFDTYRRLLAQPDPADPRAAPMSAAMKRPESTRHKIPGIVTVWRQSPQSRVRRRGTVSGRRGIGSLKRTITPQRQTSAERLDDRSGARRLRSARRDHRAVWWSMGAGGMTISARKPQWLAKHRQSQSHVERR